MSGCCYSSFSDAKLLELLFTEEDRLPRQAVDEILRRRETLAHPLTLIIDDEKLWTSSPPRGWAVVHATYLIAALKCPGALSALTRALRKASASANEWVADPMIDMLASFGVLAFPLLNALLADTSESVRVRNLASDAMETIAVRHSRIRSKVANGLRQEASKKTNDDEVREFAAFCLLSMAVPADRDLLMSLAGNYLFTEEDVERAIEGGISPSNNSRDWLRFYDPEQRERRRLRWSEVTDDDWDEDNGYLPEYVGIPFDESGTHA